MVAVMQGSKELDNLDLIRGFLVNTDIMAEEHILQMIRKSVTHMHQQQITAKKCLL
jgi:hypothetical protein